MSALEWSFVIIWPIAVVVINNLLAHQQLKHMAEVTSDSFNKTGQALKIVFAAVRDIEQALARQGITLVPIDSRSGDDAGNIDR